MAKGVINSVEFNKQVIATVLDNRRTRGVKTVDTDYDNQQRILPSRFRDRCVILDEALDAATHSLTGASSGLATLCQWSVDDEEYVETEDQITVWNHSESTDYAADTFGAARFIDGHYWFFGDCAAMADREGA